MNSLNTTQAEVMYKDAQNCFGKLNNRVNNFALAQTNSFENIEAEIRGFCQDNQKVGLQAFAL